VKSPIQTLLTVAALPLCAYAGYLLVRGRESLLLLSKAVAFMGLIICCRPRRSRSFAPG